MPLEYKNNQDRSRAMTKEQSEYHPHVHKCIDFYDALRYGHIVVIEGEPQIKGVLPEGAKAGNVLTGEEYDPKDFVFNLVISHCPFCGQELEAEEQ